MTKTILFVDDEKQILKALQSLFMQDDYTIFTAESGQEALEIVNRENINLVVSDMRMPVMDGYQLLKQVRDKKPTALRIILSGYADEKLIFKALQDGSANIHLLKPWDNDAFIKIINQILETAFSLDQRKMLEVFNQINSLPSIPIVYNRLCTLIDKEASIDEIAKVIEGDQAIAAKVLHLANATIYNRQTGSIKQAIAYLGLTNLRNIVLATTLMEGVNKTENFGYFNKKLMWRHSSYTNKIASFIYSDLLRKRMPENYMMTGLLHDIGKLILMENLQSRYEKVVEMVVKNPSEMIINAETKLLPINHQEAGGYLLSLWGLPLPIIESALYHHTPLDENVVNKEIVSVVHLADYYSWQKINKTVSAHLDANVFEFLKLKKLDCDAFIQRLNLDNEGI